MSRRRTLIAGGTVVVLAASAGFVLRGGDDAGAGTATAAGSVKTRTTKIVQTTLIETEELSGTLGYGKARSVSGGGRSGGTVTKLPEAGTVIENGEALFEADGRDVPLLYGDRPAWRTMAENMPDGADVAQLEEALVDLGFGNRREISVDQHFGAPTTAAVKRFQKAAGLDQDGILDQGEIVFLPRAVRVAELRASVGSPAGGEVMTVTSADRRITTSVEADQQDTVTDGQAVEIELPDGSRIPGTVDSISTVAVAGDNNGMSGSGSPTVEVIVTPDDPKATGRLDGAPVTIHVTNRRAEDVLAVPVSALLALAEGGYAIEREGDDGERHLVGVETGMFSDGLVEVTGDGLRAGQSVVVPA